MLKRQRNDTSSKAQFNSKPHKVKKADSKGVYKTIEYDSFEELSFLYWAFELKNQGVIKSIRRSPCYLLSDALINNYALALKTKSKPMEQKILNGHSYTPEFVIEWDYKKAKDRVIHVLGNQTKWENPIIAQMTEDGSYISHIEIKPLWDQNNMERLFKINMKWMWQRHGIYVNLIKPQELFPHSFTPKEYLVTKTGHQRKLKWKAKTIYDFLNNK